MSRLRELIKPGSASQIRGNLVQIGNRLQATSAAVQLRSVDDFQGVTVQKLLCHMAREVRAAAPAYKKDLMEFAWRTRNMFEAMLMLKHVASSEDAARSFAAQKGGDEKTIWDGIAALGDLDDTAVAVVKGRSQHIAAVLEKYGFDRASPWRMDRIAEAVEMKSEYDAFYKLYSKYVHPSAWTILSDPNEYDSEMFWDVFLIQAQLHTQHSVFVGDEFNRARSVVT